ncbi:hypothetical protein MSG28_000079 [Choristoneura fumiferana]|uniref:Uncharacterized protein n=1 Tax=Choristoneura fumiferana TaxID=7141 RepID=A0ACC0JZ37_CHOFU|nr:hypothetical protein MSG28_000079 [Choristoneura fumiferana]
MLAKHFNLVYVYFDDLYSEACSANDELGERLRKFGPSAQARASIVRRRLLAKRSENTEAGKAFHSLNIRPDNEGQAKTLCVKFRDADNIKDCIDQGWVMTAFPASGPEFELLDKMETPPNRIIFLNSDPETCRARALARGVDWCTGHVAPRGGPRVLPHPRDSEAQVDFEASPYEALDDPRTCMRSNDSYTP